MKSGQSLHVCGKQSPTDCNFSSISKGYLIDKYIASYPCLDQDVKKLRIHFVIP